jgi:hypothetical protein
MSTIPSQHRLLLAKCLGWRRLYGVVSLLLLAVSSAGTLRGQDWARDERAAARAWSDEAQSLAWARGERETARTSALHNIAVIQASNGDVAGAKETVSQLVEGREPGSSEVTVVWFCNGTPIYDHPPKTAGWNNSGWEGFFNHEPAADRVPSAVPPGLPGNYLAADPRHGVLVEFSDETDSRGTRVTSRKYADGYVAIETPRTVALRR